MGKMVKKKSHQKNVCILRLGLGNDNAIFIEIANLNKLNLIYRRQFSKLKPLFEYSANNLPLSNFSKLFKTIFNSILEMNLRE